MARRNRGSKRRPKKKARGTPKRQRLLDIDPLALSVDQLCALTTITRDKFYDLLRQGRGPPCVMLGRRRLITLESAKQWLREG